MFDLADIDRCETDQQLDALRAKYAEGCRKIVEEAKRVQKELQGTSATS